MKHASALAAITNPTVNSYKRINAPRTISGATWAPNTRHLDRQQPHPHGARARSRPLRTASAGWRGQSLSAAGDHHRGRSQRHRAQCRSGPRTTTSTCTRTATPSPMRRKLPLNLLDALREYDKDEELKVGAREELLQRLPEAQASGVEHLHAPISPNGSGRRRSTSDASAASKIRSDGMACSCYPMSLNGWTGRPMPR